MERSADAAEAGKRGWSRKERRSRMKVSIANALVGGVVLLVLLSVGGVLAISLIGAGANTVTLLRDKADIGLELLDSRIRSQLDPVEASAQQLAEWLADGTIDQADEAEIATALTGGLSALPQATAAIYVGSDNRIVRVVNAGGLLRTDEGAGPAPDRDPVRRLMRDLRGAPTSRWLDPEWVRPLRQPVLTVAAPVRQNGTFRGAVVVSIALGNIADYLATLSTEDGTEAFVLHDARHVLAHPNFVEVAREFRSTDRHPLPPLTAFNDPGFALITGTVEGDVETFEFDSFRGFDGGEHVVLMRELSGYSPLPWQIGLTLPESVANAELERLGKIGVLGLAVLVIAMFIGLRFGRRLTRQIRNLTDAAERLRSLDLTDAMAVPDSRFRELSNAAQAFNAMIGALRRFETYVPKSLVLRLMRMGEAAAASQEREVTVMFTDIRGFSAIAEQMSAVDTAALLNRHFDLLAARIEAENGTVDKFVGDGVMAFWGAPDDMDDHAARALRAATAIQDGLIRENRAARSRGDPTLSMRIGIHSGPVVVGNIGSRSRVNYTVVGDTVNTAARLEAMGKEVATEEDCVTLFSSATERLVSGQFSAASIGVRELKGRVGALEVYCLINRAEAGPALATVRAASAS